MIGIIELDHFEHSYPLLLYGAVYVTTSGAITLNLAEGSRMALQTL